MQKIQNQLTKTQKRGNQGKKDESRPIRIVAVGPAHETKPWIGREVQGFMKVGILMIKGEYFCVKHVIEKVVGQKRIGKNCQESQGYDHMKQLHLFVIFYKIKVKGKEHEDKKYIRV